jgi:uncharacterized caspase-like protein
LVCILDNWNEAMVIRYLRLAVLAAVALLVAPSLAYANKRVALVIGNSAYKHTARLANPKNDASDIAATLKKHGFEVIKGVDLDKASFDCAIRDFAVALDGAAAGVFFYAGHGLQVGGVNYLVPVDAQLSAAAALEFEMVELHKVQRVMERLTTTNVIFLDACRDNPLARNLARNLGTRSSEIGHGLAAVEGGAGTLISFSTQPGNVAQDGAGRNSPYAAALAKHLKGTGDDLGAILIAVRNDVMNATQRKQVPWEHSALTRRFFFGPQAIAPPAPAARRPCDAGASRRASIRRGLVVGILLRDLRRQEWLVSHRHLQERGARSRWRRGQAQRGGQLRPSQHSQAGGQG